MSAVEKEHGLLTARQHRHSAATAVTETAREPHDAELLAERRAHDDAMRNMDRALASRDVIGQAKGIIMATMHCTADTAFDVIRTQSQVENRKAFDVASEIVARVTRHATANGCDVK